MKRKSTAGFTLIEVMIVVAIIGLLAAIAYPSYAEHIRKGRRAEGRTALLALLQQQERYMTQRNCYLAFDTAPNGVAAAQPSCGATPAAVPFKTFSGDNADDSAYLLGAGACPDPAGGSPLPLADCVLVTAIPRRDDPVAGSLTLTSTGLRGCTGTATSDPRVCWP